MLQKLKFSQTDGLNTRAIEPVYDSLKLVESKRSYLLSSGLLGLTLCAVVALVICIPWQQSISGIGKVIIFSPSERPQNIEAPISARLREWKVVDGQSVEKGQLLLELTDIDPKFLDPHQADKLRKQKIALEARRSAAKSRLMALTKQAESLRNSQSVAVPSASERSKQAKDRIWAAEQSLEAVKQNAITADLNLSRLKSLYEKGLRSKRDLELAVLDNARALTEVERAMAAAEIAKRDQTLAVFDQTKVVADTDAAINSIIAASASAQETIESTTVDIHKLEIDIENVEGRLQQRKVYAPCSGKIVRLMRLGEGTTVDAGTVLAVIAPQTQDLAAELVVSDNDAPLISVGRPVRLQFAGWPALQFSGWPAIAVGTFAGRVSVVDAVDDGKSNYRVIIKPDLKSIEAGIDEPWPSSAYLRPGSEASGWIMLDTVPLGFELWRQFNAFPPTVNPEDLGMKKEMDIEKLEKKRKAK